MSKILILFLGLCLGDPWETATPQSLGWCSPSLDSLSQFLGNSKTSFAILPPPSISAFLLKKKSTL